MSGLGPSQQPDATVDAPDFGFRMQGDLIHVGQALAQRVEVHLGPVGAWVGAEYLDDLLDGTKGALAGLAWGRITAVPMNRTLIQNLTCRHAQNSDREIL
jgi:hypothetical protein